jgi:hypothetical protein
MNTTTKMNANTASATNHRFSWDTLVAEKRAYDLKWFGKKHDPVAPPCLIPEKFKITQKNEPIINYETANLLFSRSLSANYSAIPFLEKNQELIHWDRVNDLLRSTLETNYPSLYPTSLSSVLDEFKKEVVQISPEYISGSPFLFDPKIVKLLKNIDISRFPIALYEGHPFNHMKWEYLIETVRNKQPPSPKNDLEDYMMQRIHKNPIMKKSREIKNFAPPIRLPIHSSLKPCFTVSRPENLSSFLEEFKKEDIIRICPKHMSTSPFLFHPQVVEILTNIDLSRFPVSLLYKRDHDLWNRKKWEYLIQLVQNPVFSEPPKNAIEEDLWSNICANPGAIELIRLNIDFADWLRLSQNSAAIEILKANPEKVFIGYACSNPRVSELFV